MGGAAYQLDRESITLHHPVELRCKFKVEPELVLKVQGAGQRPHRGVPIGKMSELYPLVILKDRAMSEARQFVGYMRRQGFEPTEPESTMRLWGPFREKMDMSRGDKLENFEEGNHLIPQGMWRSQAHGAWEPDLKGEAAGRPRWIDKNRVLNSQDYRHGCAYFIVGNFLAKHGKEEERTGTLIVGG